MTDPRITLPRAPGLTDYRQLNRYFQFVYKFGSEQKFSGSHKHHIHPSKMGGEDCKENTVFLTSREHYIAHQILFRAFRKSQEAQRAAWLMSHTQEGFLVNSRMYSFLKDNYIFSEETRKKLSEAGKGREYTPEQKAQISLKNKETYHNTPEHVLRDRVERMRAKKKGSQWTDKQRSSITGSLPRGRNHWRLKNNPLWERADEILETWLNSGRPGFAKLCKILGIPKTKSVMSIIKSII